MSISPGAKLLGEQTSREVFECLRWHDGQRERCQPQGKVRTPTQKLVLKASDMWGYISLLSRLWKDFLRGDQKAEAQLWEARQLFVVKVKGPSQTCLLPQEQPDLLPEGDTRVFTHYNCCFFSALMLHLWSWAVSNVTVKHRRPNPQPNILSKWKLAE